MFVDQVSVYVKAGDGETELLLFAEKSMSLKVVQQAAMEETVVTLYLK